MAASAATISAHRPGRSPVPPWLLKLLAVPAAIAVWSGWVGVGQMTGFGEVRPLPGIWSSLHVNTAVTLPVGVEAYAVLAMRTWLSGTIWATARTRRFACWSAIGSLVLGMTGQACYHLLSQSGASRAPWEVTTLVSCLPVLFLGLGAALAHMLREDAATCQVVDGPLESGPDVPAVTDQSLSGPGSGPSRTRTVADSGSVLDGSGPVMIVDHDGQSVPDRSVAEESARESPYVGPRREPRLVDAETAAAKLASSGRRVSRRSLRAAGIRGSNTELAALAHAVRASQGG